MKHGCSLCAATGTCASAEGKELPRLTLLSRAAGEGVQFVQEMAVSLFCSSQNHFSTHLVLGISRLASRKHSDSRALHKFSSCDVPSCYSCGNVYRRPDFSMVALSSFWETIPLEMCLSLLRVLVVLSKATTAAFPENPGF